jgi:hypothetical protein
MDGAMSRLKAGIVRYHGSAGLCRRGAMGMRSAGERCLTTTDGGVLGG